MISGKPKPTRRGVWMLIGLAGLFVLITFLASRQVRIELAALGLAVVLLSALVRRRAPVIEIWRFIAGPLVFLLTVLASEAATGLWGARAGLLTRALTLALDVLGVGWSVLALARLGAGGWYDRSWRALLPACLAYLLVVVRASPTAVSLCLVAVALWGIPTGWLEGLASTRIGRWQTGLLILLTPLAFIFTAAVNISGPEVAVAGTQEKVSGMVGSVEDFLLFFWLTLPLRLILRGFKHLMLGLSIRMRLLLTYFFSTLVPGTLAFVLVGVAVFAGIGTLRARVVSNLVTQDLEALASQLDDIRLSSFAPHDSLAAGLYARGSVDTTATEAIVVPADLALLADSLLPSALGTLHVGALPSGRVAATPDAWVRLAQRASWALPDTLRVDSGMFASSSRGTAIASIGRGRAALLAAELTPQPQLVRILARPLNESVVERYKEVVGTDLIISPTATMTLRPQGSEVTLTDEGEADSVAPIATRVSNEGRGLFSRQLRHGICELQAATDTTDAGRMRGVVVVRTSLAGLAARLFATRGINLVVVVVVGVLAGLIVIAAFFTTVIGFSLNGTITSSMTALKRGAERLRQGDLDARIETPARGEMGRLADSFNGLAHDLRRLVHQVAEKERLDRELQIAREIQVNLLPGLLPDVKGLELAATSRPAREVGGDYYDALMVEPGRLVLVVADVSGKGVAAAMLMSNLQSALHVLLSQELPLDTVVGRLNSLVCKNSPPEMFITLFIGVVDTLRLQLDYVNAGHDEPLIIRGDSTLRLGPGGLLLGMFPEATHRTGHIELHAGDVLALYSDGVTEAMNAGEEEFGVTRLEEALRSAAGLTAADTLAAVLAEVQRHIGEEAAPYDDLTFLVARVVGSAGAT